METYPVAGNTYNTSIISQLLLDTISDIGAEQCVKFPTRGNNILDVFISNRLSLVEKIRSVTIINCLCTCVIYCTTIQATQTQDSPLEAISERIQATVQEFANVFLSDKNVNTDVNVLWETFKVICNEVIEANVPSKNTYQRYSQLCVNRKIKRLSRPFRRFKCTKNP